MMSKDNIKEQILKNQYVVDWFEGDLKEIDNFAKLAEKGETMDERKMLSLLIDVYIENCGISISYRTVAFEAGETIFYKYIAENETEFSQEDSYFDALGRLNESYNEYKESYDRYDITSIKMSESIDICMYLCNEMYNDETTIALAYGTWLMIHDRMTNCTQEQLQYL